MLHFELVTPEKLVRSEDVYMVVVPGTEGDFGVLEGHAPLMSTVRDGALSVYRTEGGQPETIAIFRRACDKYPWADGIENLSGAIADRLVCNGTIGQISHGSARGHQARRQAGITQA